MGEHRKYIARCRGKTHFTGLDIQKIVVVSGPLSSVSGLLNLVSGLLIEIIDWINSEMQ